MTTKCWSFLLPGSGTHEIRAEALDSYTPSVFFDSLRLELCRAGMPLSEHGRVLSFVGPNGEEIELYLHRGECTLRVNGNYVEEYVAGQRASGDNSLRQLRGMPDGSYLICTEFDATRLNLNIVRKFRFATSGQVHEVQIAHGEGIWQVIFDGAIVDRVAHKFKDTAGSAAFDGQAEDGMRLRTTVYMSWIVKGEVPDVQEDVDTALGNRYGFGTATGSWRYDVIVNGLRVPVCWTKAKGDVMGVGPPPEVPQAEEDAGPPEASFLSPKHGDAGPAAVPEMLSAVPPPLPEAMPQGVSFDSVSGAYQASIRAKSGKFVFLGEFRTPEEAHQRYLEAVPIHCPDKVLVPGVP